MDKTAMLLDHLTQAQQLVAEGEARIAQQKRRIAELRRDGHDTSRAEELLKTFVESQRHYEDTLARVRAEISELKR
jgi:hypothetical protein